MTLRRLPPLAIALALVAAALVATVIATRHSVNDAFATVGDGQAIAEELDVRADLSDLEGPPTSAQLDAILASHRDEGVRYLALVDSRANVIAESGTPRGTLVPRALRTRRACRRPLARRVAVRAPELGPRWARHLARPRDRAVGGERAAHRRGSFDPDRPDRGRRAIRRRDRTRAARAAEAGRRACTRARAPAREPRRDVRGARARDQEPARVAEGQRPAARELAARWREATREGGARRRRGGPARKVDPGPARVRPDGHDRAQRVRSCDPRARCGQQRPGRGDRRSGPGPHVPARRAADPRGPRQLARQRERCRTTGARDRRGRGRPLDLRGHRSRSGRPSRGPRQDLRAVSHRQDARYRARSRDRQAPGRAPSRYDRGRRRPRRRRALPHRTSRGLMSRILVADDEPGIREFVRDALELDSHECVQAPDGRAAAKLLEERGFDLVITDLKMPGMDGMALLRKIRAEQPEVEVIVLTAHGNVDNAVEAMKLGAFEFLQKPLSGPDELRLLVSRAVERRGLKDRGDGAEHALAAGPPLTYGDPAMKPVVGAIDKVAKTAATVLLLGESGTGKEVAARAIHAQSPRATKPFMAINCAALH